MTYTVYALRERGTAMARYVGKTLYPKHRLTQHFQAARRGQYAEDFCAWLLSHDVEIVDLSHHHDSADANKAERLLIAALATLGQPLFNITCNKVGAVKCRVPYRAPASAQVAA